MAFPGNGERMKVLDDGLQWFESRGKYPTPTFKGLMLDDAKAGLELLDKGLDCLERGIYPSFGQCLALAELLGNIKDESGFRVPYWQDKAILLWEKVFSDDYKMGRAIFSQQHPKGSALLELHRTMLESSKKEREYR